MMKSFMAALLLAVLVAIHVQALGRAGDERKLLPSDTGSGLVIPSSVLKITSLEFKGIVSDLLFLKVLIFDGGTYQRNKEPRMSPEEWQWLDKELTASTDLDPYFVDPYYLANAHMTWEGGMVREANKLLEKGTQYRDWDWELPFYAGFNYFFFLHDNAKAADLLATAAKRPGPSGQLLSLAARLAYTEKKTENAIVFLETLLEKTEENRLRKQYKIRIHALRTRLLLERGVSSYKIKFGKYPSVLQDLVATGIITDIPRDPYGGNFSMGPQGQIASTSDYLLMIKQRTEKSLSR
jgi:hypothetical protein